VAELPPDGVVPAGVVAPPDGDVDPPDGVVDPLGVVPVVLEEELVEEEEDEEFAAPDGVGAVGTLNCGTPAVSPVPVPPPPQAARPTPAATARTVAAMDLDLRATGRLMTPLRSRAAPCACRTRGSR
jgi:hypothetical protein